MATDETLTLFFDDKASFETLVSDQLVRARVRSGLSVDAVAERLLLSPRQVRALEAGDTHVFHNAGFYTRAQHKYQALLGLSLARSARSPDDACRSFTTGVHPLRLRLVEDPPPERVQPRLRVRASLLATILAGALASALIAGFYVGL
jgi:cytoskeletal protein RodZ